MNLIDFSWMCRQIVFAVIWCWAEFNKNKEKNALDVYFVLNGFEMLNIEHHKIPSLRFQKPSLLMKAAVLTSSIFLDSVLCLTGTESQRVPEKISLNVSKDSQDHFHSSGSVFLLPLLFLAGKWTNSFFFPHFYNLQQFS